MILERLKRPNVIPVVVLEPKDFDSKNYAFDLLTKADRCSSAKGREAARHFSLPNARRGSVKTFSSLLGRDVQGRTLNLNHKDQAPFLDLAHQAQNTAGCGCCTMC